MEEFPKFQWLPTVWLATGHICTKISQISLCVYRLSFNVIGPNVICYLQSPCLLSVYIVYDVSAYIERWTCRQGSLEVAVCDLEVKCFFLQMVYLSSSVLSRSEMEMCWNRCLEVADMEVEILKCGSCRSRCLEVTNMSVARRGRAPANSTLLLRYKSKLNFGIKLLSQ